MLNPEAEKQVYAAGVLIKEHQPGEAATLLQETILRFPDAGKAFALLGYIYAKYFHEPFTAEEHFKKAMVMAADFPFTYIYYAEALMAQERYTEATAVLNKSLETTAAPKDSIFHLFGLMNEKQSRYEEAVEEYQKAIIASTDNQLINDYQQAINRCISKQKLFVNT